MRSLLRRLVLFALILLPGTYPVLAQAEKNGDVFSGDTRLACEAVLCLSSGTRPSECAASLSRYFGINKKKFSDTLKARLNFLELCPASDDSPAMRELVKAISQGAGRCDADALNTALGTWIGDSSDGRPFITNKRPSYCSVYASHDYTAFDDDLPVYVGTPSEGGYWVEVKDYERELAKYEKELAERKEREQIGHGTGYGMAGN